MIKLAGKVVGLERVQRKMQAVARASRDMRPVWRDNKAAFRAEQKRHFTEEMGPDGRWAPLAKATQDRRLARKRGTGRRRRKRKARLLGKLRSFAVRTNRRSMMAVSRVPWSGVHQAGGRVGNGARVPARPFLWVADKWLRRNVVSNVRRYLRRVMRAA